MVAYIVGMVTGTVCLIMPLLYAMNVNHCVARIMAANPQFDPKSFLAYTPQGLMYPVTVVGAIVLLLSAALMAYTSLGQGRAKRPKPAAEEPKLAPEKKAPPMP